MDFLERLIDEEKNLHTKIVALDRFIYNSTTYETLDVIHQSLLLEQLAIMNTYDRILQDRIHIIEGEKNGKN